MEDELKGLWAFLKNTTVHRGTEIVPGALGESQMESPAELRGPETDCFIHLGNRTLENTVLRIWPADLPSSAKSPYES